MRSTSPLRARPWRLLAPLLVLVVSGCKLPMPPNYDDPPWDDELRDRGHQLLLGVVVDTARPHPDGVQVERVLAGSPAADAGVQPGDVLVRVGAAAVRTPDDLAAVLAEESSQEAWRAKYSSPAARKESAKLREQFGGMFTGMTHDDPRVGYDLTLLRGGKERVVEASLTSAELHAERTVARVKAAAAARRTGVWIPFVIDVVEESVSAADWLAWFGRRVTEDPVLYEDLDIVPAWVASLWRQEATPLDGNHRMTLVHWPLRLTWSDDEDEYLNEILAEGEVTRAIF